MKEGEILEIGPLQWKDFQDFFENKGGNFTPYTLDSFGHYQDSFFGSYKISHEDDNGTFNLTKLSSQINLDANFIGGHILCPKSKEDLRDFKGLMARVKLDNIGEFLISKENPKSKIATSYILRPVKE